MMIEIEKLDQILEAILFVSGDGIEIKDLTEKLELQPSEMKQAIKRLQQKYCDDCGIYLISFNNKIQFSTNPSYADTVSLVLNPIKEKELSRAAMEAMAIIAYKQPITRLEVEQVRGVNSDYAIQMLQKNNLIQIVGRKDTIGKPLLFGTTDEFLKRFGISDLAELPDYDMLMERIKIIPTATEGESMYNEFQIPDEDLGMGEDEANDGVEMDEIAGEVEGVAVEATAVADGGLIEESANGDTVETIKNDALAEKTGRAKKTRKQSRILPKDDLPEEEIPDFLKDEDDLQIIN